jgi:2-keto-4-pentenoate hydratase/2-oxohepta-3-ene-1,7-dioic acid hydratase in catechol pathway
VKLAVFGEDLRPGLVDGDRIANLTPFISGWIPGSPSAVNGFLGDWQGRADELVRAAADGPWLPLDSVRLQAPVPLPTQVLAAPLNFVAHRAEMTGPITSGAGTANELGFFLKASRSVSAPSAPILLPDVDGRRIDFEAEVAVVIGKEAQGVSPEDALDFVLGYTMVLDMSLRMTETQREERTQRKSYATFTPMGPWITTAEEIPDPSQITLKAWRNDELRQDACLADLIVSVPDLVSRASHVVSLDAGDVYATGSPAGVGQVQPGDTIRLESPQLGTMTLSVAQRPW